MNCDHTKSDIDAYGRCKPCRNAEAKLRYAEDVEYRARTQAHGKRHREKHPDRVSTSIRRRNEKIRKQVVEGYGGKCGCCGETEAKFLGIDHINGGGTQERKSNSGYTLYRRLIKEGFPKDEYQLLCHNCNMAKAFYKVCPHQLTQPSNIHYTLASHHSP